MRRNLYIGGGAALGAAMRYIIRNIVIFGYSGRFPLNTFFINVAGAFLLAFLLTLALEARAADSDLRLGLTAGFLGGFTTFSTLCREAVLLLQSGEMAAAAGYMAASAILGLSAAYAGSAVARRAAAALDRKREMLPEDEGEAE